MSLLGMQIALGRMVMSRAFREKAASEGQDLFKRFDVAPEERAWLAGVVRTPGFAFTCSIQCFWCELRAKSAAPLTMAALPPAQRSELLAAWVERGGGTASFFATETVAFLEFVAAHLPADTHAASICRMEQATHRVSEAARSFTQPPALPEELPAGARVQQHPAAALVRFRAPPMAVLAAALSGAPLPPAGDVAQALLFAPGLPAFFRTARAEEADLYDASAQGMSVAGLGPGARGTLAELLRIGALVAERGEG